MNKKLSRRLTACLKELSWHSKIADIGTDHAYLPCHGIANGTIDSAIAIDVIDGPLMQAKKTIADYGLGERIEVRKGSGLEPLKAGEVEGVVIAGMGGHLIAQLLLASISVAKSMKTLVFQPQGGEAALRKVLSDNKFAITNEMLLEEDGIIYTIITAKPKSALYELNELDLISGPLLRENFKQELFRKKWTQEIAAIDEILRRMPAGNERKAVFIKKKKRIEDVLVGVIS